jgi:hypothetical protein
MAIAAQKPPTPQQILAEQKRLTDTDAKRQAQATGNLPVMAERKPPAVPDNRTAHEAYLDEIAPASIVGRMVKFSKDGKFITADDDEPISEESDFIALCDQTLIGYIKFNGEGQPPSKEMGLLYDGYIMPRRENLGDNDQAQWEIGLDGKPADPWQHHVYVVLQNVGSSELFTFVTSSRTGRRAVGNLLRHYDRMSKTHPGHYPLIRLKVGGFQHRDDRVGWVPTPVLAVIGRVPGENAAKPPPADFNDEIPFA